MMQRIVKGGNAEVPTGALEVRVKAPGDISAYALGADGKVRADEDMIFFNQPRSPDGAVELVDGGFRIDLSKVASEVDRIALCAVPEGVSLAAAGSVSVEIAGMLSFSEDTSSMTEAAVILAELYRRGGGWKFRAVAQGFDGGLAPLSRHFGIDVEDEPADAATPTRGPTSAPAPTPTPSGVDLRKRRLVSLEKSDPALVDLAKKAAVSLKKRNLSGATAKVVLAIDISASMTGIYRSGQVDRTTQRLLALALNMDDDGAIPVYAFGSGAYRIGVADAGTYRTLVPDMLRSRSLEGATRYGKVIEMIRSDLRAEAGFGETPVYVLFVTDGATSDKALTERQIRDASAEGIFWQFIGIREGFFHSGFDFLEKLDDMSGRTVDNCDFFEVASLDQMSDDQVFDKLMAEYPGWLVAAGRAGVLRA